MELLNDPITSIAAGTVGFAWLGRILWRRLSKDGAEVAKDRAEINIIDTLQSQIATLSAENQRLRTTEAEVANRLGRLEAKELESQRHVEMIEKMQLKLNEKDLRIEALIRAHAEEAGAMRALLGVKDNEIRELQHSIEELKDRLKRDEGMIKCSTCSKLIAN